jgi:hypothetical protein
LIVWNEERCCRVYCPFATPLRESRLSINDLLDCCNPCKYPSESGKRLLWILSWDCLGLSLENDSLWVIVDLLAKVAHFVPINTTHTGPQLTKLYNSRIVYFHGVPMRIVPGIGTQFISMFWKKVTLNHGYPFELQFCLSPSD